MTYAQDEASRESGGTIELYEFVGPIDTFRYTNHSQNYEHLGNTFFAIPLTRSNIVIEVGKAPELSLTVPITLDLVSKYVFQIAPQGLDLSVTRLHLESGNYASYWQGPVAAFSVKERLVSIRVPSPLGQLLANNVLNIRYQPICNNVLFDPVCSLSNLTLRESGTLSTISGDGKGLVVAGTGLRGDQWARGGEIIHQTNGERRLIVDQVGTAITILWPFSVNVPAGSLVYVYAGCDHKISTCVDKFDNFNNFNGMPNVVTQKLSQEQDGN